MGEKPVRSFGNPFLGHYTIVARREVFPEGLESRSLQQEGTDSQGKCEEEPCGGDLRVRTKNEEKRGISDDACINERHHISKETREKRDLVTGAACFLWIVTSMIGIDEKVRDCENKETNDDEPIRNHRNCILLGSEGLPQKQTSMQLPRALEKRVRWWISEDQK